MFGMRNRNGDGDDDSCVVIDHPMGFTAGFHFGERYGMAWEREEDR